MPRPSHVYRQYPGVGQGVDEWATFIASRHPHFKTHQTLGPAKSAITSNGHGILYRMLSQVDGDLTWIPVAVVNATDQKTHPYRKAKPEHLTEAVVLFKITEEML